MTYSPSLPGYPVPVETVGPWGNSPEFFCDLFNREKNLEKAICHFKIFIGELLYNGKANKLNLLNSFFTTLGFSELCIDHHNGSDEKISAELDIIAMKFKNEGFKKLFIERIYERIIERVPLEKTEGIRKWVQQLEKGNLNFTAILSDSMLGEHVSDWKPA